MGGTEGQTDVIFLFNEIFFINMYLGYLKEPFVKREKKKLDILFSVHIKYVQSVLLPKTTR